MDRRTRSKSATTAVTWKRPGSGPCTWSFNWSNDGTKFLFRCRLVQAGTGHDWSNSHASTGNLSSSPSSRSLPSSIHPFEIVKFNSKCLFVLFRLCSPRVFFLLPWLLSQCVRRWSSRRHTDLRPRSGPPSLRCLGLGYLVFVFLFVLSVPLVLLFWRGPSPNPRPATLFYRSANGFVDCLSNGYLSYIQNLGCRGTDEY
jgi:hypothetical protein